MAFKRQPRSRHGLALVGGELAMLSLEGGGAGGDWGRKLKRGQKLKPGNVALWLEDPGGEMPPQAADREAAGDSFRPGQGRVVETVATPRRCRIPSRRCFSKHPDSCRRHADIDRSTPAQPERVLGEVWCRRIAPPPRRASRPHHSSSPAAPSRRRRAPPHPPCASPDARGHTGALAPAARVPAQSRENKGSPGDLGLLHPEPPAPPASGPREGVNFCSTLLLEIC